VFYLGFKVYPLHCVLATQARVCGPGRTGRTEPNTNTRYTSYGFINIFLYLYALLRPLKSAHKRPSFNFASKGKQLL
jgi:hypothetical protein